MLIFKDQFSNKVIKKCSLLCVFYCSNICCSSLFGNISCMEQSMETSFIPITNCLTKFFTELFFLRAYDCFSRAFDTRTLLRVIDTTTKPIPCVLYARKNSFSCRPINWSAIETHLVWFRHLGLSLQIKHTLALHLQN